jgi:hypothetical protein
MRTCVEFRFTSNEAISAEIAVTDRNEGNEKRAVKAEAKTACHRYSIRPISSCVSIYRCYRNHFSPRQMGAIGAVNLVVGVSLLALISEKWIRKMK